MFMDLNKLESKPIPEFDICIIGAGAAGITVAREFAGFGVRVCILESGGFEFEPDTQNLYDFESVGLPRAPHLATRLRYFGGATNHWTGRCAPLSALDFEKRDWVPHSGWPISRKSLDPYYERASETLGLGPHIYDQRTWEILGDERPDPWFNRDKLRTQFWQFSTGLKSSRLPRQFGKAYRESLQKAKNITVLLHANVTNIQTSDSRQAVTHLDVASLGGTTVQIKSKRYVLACGGIENARLLLASNKANPAGTGNQHGNVGRYFMEHPRGDCGLVAGEDLYDLQDHLQSFWHDDIKGVRHVYLAGAAASDKLQKSAKILNCDLSIKILEEAESGTRALERLLKGTSPDSGGDVWKVVKDLGEVLDNSKRRFYNKQPPIITPTRVTLECHIEQAPNPDSRITLADKRDALGIPLTKIDWRLTDRERHAIRTLSKHIATEFARLKMGRVRLADWVLDDSDNWTSGVGEGSHHMGSTRMSENARSGVVDQNCKVHGIDNLFIAGSSVFATSGCVNPTLTIVALATRLADHLKGSS